MEKEEEEKFIPSWSSDSIAAQRKKIFQLKNDVDWQKFVAKHFRTICDELGLKHEEQRLQLPNFNPRSKNFWFVASAEWTQVRGLKYFLVSLFRFVQDILVLNLNIT